MADVAKGKNFKIETGRKLTLLNCKGELKDKALLIKSDHEKKTYAIRSNFSVYDKIVNMIKMDIKNDKKDEINNILITPHDAIVLIMKDKKIKPLTLKFMISDNEEDGESAIKIDGIDFNGKIFPVIIKDSDTIATRDANNNII